MHSPRARPLLSLSFAGSIVLACSSDPESPVGGGQSGAPRKAGGAGTSGSPSGGNAGSGGFVDAYPHTNWPSIHRDARNSDALGSEGATSLKGAFDAQIRTIAAVLTVGPSGTLFATTGNSKDGSGCHLWALDPSSGATQWCSPEVGPRAVSSSVLSDRDGNLFIADDTSMWSFTSTGEKRWQSPIKAAPQSAQFLGDGSLFFITRNGVAYGLSREDGSQLLPPQELVPGLVAGDQKDCLTGGSEGTCAAANAPAVDLASNRIYLTLNRPDQSTTSLLALEYRPGKPGSLHTLWESQVLGAGGGASPTLSADSSGLYVTDASNQLLALNAHNGSVIWSRDIGFAPLGSPAVSADGLIFPGPKGPLLAIRDLGETSKVELEIPEAGATGVVALAGTTGYTVGENSLLVFKTATGEITQKLAGPAISIGTTIASNGYVYTAGFTRLFAYSPSQ